MKNVKVEDLLNIKCVWRYVCVAVAALAGVVLFVGHFKKSIRKKKRVCRTSLMNLAS